MAERILVFSAHAADFCSRAGGAIALHAAAGAAVHIIDLTFGERGESEDYWAHSGEHTLAEAKAIRRDEASRAAAILGATIDFLDYGDYPLEMGAERVETLAHAIRSLRPGLILTHWNHDPYNLDHEVTANAVLRAASIAAVPGFDPDTPRANYPAIYAFEPTVPRNDDTGFRPTHYVAIDEVFDKKMAALAEFRCQSKLPGMYTQWGDYRGAQARQWCNTPVRRAEAFQRYTASVATLLP